MEPDGLDQLLVSHQGLKPLLPPRGYVCLPSDRPTSFESLSRGSIFFLVWFTLKDYFRYIDETPCALVCETIGYTDDWQRMATFKQAKVYLSLCVCIQLLKILKFLSVLIPKMDLAPIVLKKALVGPLTGSVTFCRFPPSHLPPLAHTSRPLASPT